MSAPAYSFRVTWSEEDELYVATSPEFEGVSGHGASAEAALRQARKSLALAIEAYESEGWELPKPLLLTEHSGQFRLRLPHTLHSQLVERAAVEGVSLNAFVSTLIATGFGALGMSSYGASVADPAMVYDRPAGSARKRRKAKR